MTMPDVQFRLTESERRLGALETRTEDYSGLRAEIGGLRDVVEDLRDEVKSLRRSVVTAAISFAGGAMILALSILVAVAH